LGLRVMGIGSGLMGKGDEYRIRKMKRINERRMIITTTTILILIVNNNT